VSSALSIITPIRSVLNDYTHKTGLGFKFLEPKINLIAENERLKERVSTLESGLVATRVLEYENNQLRQILEVEAQISIPASVLLSYPSTPYDTLLLDKGSVVGVSVGGGVFTNNRVALGTVEEVGPSYSKIRLYSSAGINTEGFLLRTGEGLSIEGRGGGSFSFRAPKEFDIQSGDIMILPGLEKYSLAIVDSIKEEGDSSFRNVLLSTPFVLRADSIILINK
jgi:cell shape-determining protein MreC